ncbi:hypothetical protein [Streptomyces sp. TBY4]|uniref:hypothetical protein n=1 Tax=Streptomyces sp. TBY4 TaxID=2962030 RepID=UPI0020B8A7C1|nr:hypothetical protein [Streptomyces sp. TBY4]MCP3758997.1 hypothetical protein [Streptomyces sp. TBY4]
MGLRVDLSGSGRGPFGRAGRTIGRPQRVTGHPELPVRRLRAPAGAAHRLAPQRAPRGSGDRFDGSRQKEIVLEYQLVFRGDDETGGYRLVQRGKQAGRGFVQHPRNILQHEGTAQDGPHFEEALAVRTEIAEKTLHEGHHTARDPRLRQSDRSAVLLYQPFLHEPGRAFGEQPGIPAGLGRDVDQPLVRFAPEDVPQDLLDGGLGAMTLHEQFRCHEPGLPPYSVRRATTSAQKARPPAGILRSRARS